MSKEKQPKSEQTSEPKSEQTSGNAPQELAKSQPKGLALTSNLPDYLQQYVEEHGATGTEGLQELIQPPALKIIQPQATAPYSDLFNPGDVCAVPVNTLVAPVELSNGRPTASGTPFIAAPILQYTEYCAWNPIETRGSLPTIRERSFDPLSEVGVRCKDAKYRDGIPCPELPEKRIRYSTHLNYIVVLLDYSSELAGIPILVSFFRGNYKMGQRLATLVKMKRAPIFACRFAFQTSRVDNDQRGKYYAWQVDLAEPCFVTEDELEVFAKLHDEMATALRERKLIADYDADAELEHAAAANTVDGSADKSGRGF